MQNTFYMYLLVGCLAFRGCLKTYTSSFAGMSPRRLWGRSGSDREDRASEILLLLSQTWPTTSPKLPSILPSDQTTLVKNAGYSPVSCHLHVAFKCLRSSCTLQNGRTAFMLFLPWWIIRSASMCSKQDWAISQASYIYKKENVCTADLENPS